MQRLANPELSKTTGLQVKEVLSHAPLCAVPNRFPVFISGSNLVLRPLMRPFSFPTLMMISPAVRRIWAHMKSIGLFRITGRGREYSSEARDNSVQNLPEVIGESGRFEFEMRGILK
jgi:hypothetical protein